MKLFKVKNLNILIKRGWDIYRIIIVIILFINLNGESLALSIPPENAITVCYNGCNFTSIQEAINNANSGDIIFVYNGTYNESTTVRINKSLSLIGQDKETTIINSPAILGSYYPDLTVIDIAGSNNNNPRNINVTLEGFTIDGNLKPLLKFCVLVRGGAYAEIRDNIILNTLPNFGDWNSGNVIVGWMDYGYKAQALIENNYITNFHSFGVASYGPGNVATIRNNRIIGNSSMHICSASPGNFAGAIGIIIQSDAIANITGNLITGMRGNPVCHPANYDAAMEVYWSGDMIIENNTFFDNDYGFGSYNEYAGDSIVFNNNNISNNNIGVLIGGLTVNSFSGNIFENNTNYSLISKLTEDLNVTNNYWGSTNLTQIYTQINGSVLFGSWCLNSLCEEFSEGVDIIPDEMSHLDISGRFIPSNKTNSSNSQNYTAKEDITIRIENSIIKIKSGTVLTRSDNLTFSIENMIAQIPSLENISGLNEDLQAVIEWGLKHIEMEFSKNITISLYVGDKFEGKEMKIARSTLGNSSWTTEGLSSNSCIIVNGLCSFNASKASYYAVTYNAPPTTKKNKYYTGGGCYTEWICNEWSNCSDSGIRTRICSKKNPLCKTKDEKPLETQECKIESLVINETISSENKIKFKCDFKGLDYGYFIFCWYWWVLIILAAIIIITIRFHKKRHLLNRKFHTFKI